MGRQVRRSDAPAAHVVQTIRAPLHCMSAYISVFHRRQLACQDIRTFKGSSNTPRSEHPLETSPCPWHFGVTSDPRSSQSALPGQSLGPDGLEALRRQVGQRLRGQPAPLPHLQRGDMPSRGTGVVLRRPRFLWFATGSTCTAPRTLAVVQCKPSPGTELHSQRPVD